jgi:hypothetical protein
MLHVPCIDRLNHVKSSDGRRRREPVDALGALREIGTAKCVKVSLAVEEVDSANFSGGGIVDIQLLLQSRDPQVLFRAFAKQLQDAIGRQRAFVQDHEHFHGTSPLSLKGDGGNVFSRPSELSLGSIAWVSDGALAERPCAERRHRGMEKRGRATSMA